MKTLETKRLILRPFTETDLEDFYEYARNPAVGPNAGWEPHKCMDDSENILMDFIQNDEVWALEYKDSSKVIGSLGLHKDPLRSAKEVKMLGYVLSENYWGLGLMPEAVKAVLPFVFDELGVNLLTVHHYTFNLRSKRVIEKCGFTYEGTLRYAARIYDGAVHDLACYSMTKEEYHKLKS